MDPVLNRRRVITGIAALLLAGPALAARLLQTTPRQTAGPFYPAELPLDHDNNLVEIQGVGQSAKGRITDLSGRLLDVNDRPLDGVRIEIWQCDANGRYHHPRDSGGGPVDENFQGFGRTVTDAQGRYRFRTIRPVPYPGRTPHIHMAVFPDGVKPFITQLYVKNEPRNAQDFIFNRIPADRRHLVLAEFAPASAGGATLAANFDIVLGDSDGTPRA
jgi:protocatechuate 3,4-dioxygenase, beta subunit